MLKTVKDVERLHEQAINIVADPVASDPGAAHRQALTLMGIDLLASLAIDLKRIADALEANAPVLRHMALAIGGEPDDLSEENVAAAFDNRAGPYHPNPKAPD